MVEVDFLSRVKIFSSLAPDDLAELAALWRPFSREEGQIVFRQGDPPHAMYLVREGKDLSLLGDGDFFGELALLDGSPRTATTKAIGHAELVEMAEKDLFAFLRRKPEVAISMMSEIASRLRTSNLLIEHRSTRNVNQVIEEKFTFGDRLADRIAQFGGSWTFLICFGVTLVLWMGLNSVQSLWHPFDPYPFIFLNLILSCLAAVQAPVIMMSQNRQAMKDRLQADLDYQVNLKAELQIRSLHLKIDELRTTELRDFFELQREHLAIQREQIEILRHRDGSAT
jgi:CRP/FNR family transcriptional regulator, cyclic AMP receptor protein